MRRCFALATACWLVICGVPDRSSAQPLVDLVTRVTPSVAFVLAKDRDGKPMSGGSAFVIAPGVLLTALHVVQQATEVSVQLPGAAALAAEVVGIDIDHDIALLHAAGLPAGATPLALGDSTAVQLGQAIAVVGYPLSSPDHPTVTVTQGIVSALRTQEGMLQIDAAINPGASGGPVLTADGRVIGIVDASLRGAQSFNFAVPIDLAKPLVQRAPTLGRLPLPLTSSKEVTLGHSGSGIAPGTHEEREGSACVDPPPRAAVLAEVRVEMDVQRPLHMLAWLSWERGIPPEDPNKFAQIDDTVPRQLIRPLTMEAPPATVCLNYLAYNNDGGGANRTFSVSYTLVYRVFDVPSTTAVSH
ncbi:MAG TPA: S1C family serine protease [bacterium]|nr:S1C family serine protease [bacterium]